MTEAAVLTATANGVSTITLNRPKALKGPRAVYGRTKALLNGSLDASLESQLQREAEAFAQSASEPDFAEGIRAFVEKRKPQWQR